MTRARSKTPPESSWRVLADTVVSVRDLSLIGGHLHVGNILRHRGFVLVGDGTQIKPAPGTKILQMERGSSSPYDTRYYQFIDRVPSYLCHWLKARLQP